LISIYRWYALHWINDSSTFVLLFLPLLLFLFFLVCTISVLVSVNLQVLLAESITCCKILLKCWSRTAVVAIYEWDLWSKKSLHFSCNRRCRLPALQNVLRNRFKVDMLK
jgi:hypothetical protein